MLETIRAATVQRTGPLCGVFTCIFSIYFHRSIFMNYGKVKEFKVIPVNATAER